jgi:urate oxidase
MDDPGILVHHAYGKTDVRLLRLDRSVEPHRVVELSIEIRLEGDFAEAYRGDNGRVLPTDSMKNMVYVLARSSRVAGPESFGLELARHLLATQPQVERVVIDLRERPWAHYAGAVDAFVGAGDHRRTAVVNGGREGLAVRSGIADLLIMKTARSGFSGFPAGPTTTLAPTDDRILATRLDASWTLADAEADAEATRSRVEAALAAAFIAHHSESVQHTLEAMGQAALTAAPEITQIHLLMPNKHYLLANLAPFGLDNPNLVFVPTDEPAGRIEGTLRRRR